MTSFRDLWTAYGHEPRPANIGAVIDGVRIGALDDEIQDRRGISRSMPRGPLDASVDTA